jgi:hypothetical protein
MAAQLPDLIFFQSRQLELYSNPLESYWVEHHKKRPSFQPAILCRRGYVATWEIRENQLLLKGIDGNIEQSHWVFWRKVIPYSLNMLFKNTDAGVLAAWFTGKIRIPQGKIILYVHHDYDSRFEREILITIRQGLIIKTVVLDNTQHQLE